MTRRYWNINLEEMTEAGVHFGHGTRKWNPKMAPYIAAKRKGIHVTNLTRTARFLSEACDLVFDAASRGKHFVIVGDSVAWAAIRSRCHYVNKKWFGGSAAIAVRNSQTIPTGGQNFFEYVLEVIRDVSKTQIREEYGALLPWKIIQLSHGELAAPTNDINTTVALALLMSVAYFYAVSSVVSIPVMFLGLFTSGIQALIFATLAAAYIGESMEGNH
ncbi:hypothetical protein ACH5RR_000006 [Cinchona calisaya]|uniref:30S ribosomal protein S2, chloroplastic n=1 Tax=Cinchona calisaya TaxID=153742 RepID=A0ABD3AZH4_9GENT